MSRDTTKINMTLEPYWMPSKTPDGISAAPFGVDQFSHQDAQIECGYSEEIALVDVLPSAQPRPAHWAAIRHVLIATFCQFRAALL
jgi:hypothetical protein